MFVDCEVFDSFANLITKKLNQFLILVNFEENEEFWEFSQILGIIHQLQQIFEVCVYKPLKTRIFHKFLRVCKLETLFKERRQTRLLEVFPIYWFVN